MHSVIKFRYFFRYPLHVCLFVLLPHYLRYTPPNWPVLIMHVLKYLRISVKLPLCSISISRTLLVLFILLLQCPPYTLHDLLTTSYVCFRISVRLLNYCSLSYHSLSPLDEYYLLLISHTCINYCDLICNPYPWPLGLKDIIEVSRAGGGTCCTGSWGVGTPIVSKIIMLIGLRCWGIHHFAVTILRCLVMAINFNLSMQTPVLLVSGNYLNSGRFILRCSIYTCHGTAPGCNDITLVKKSLYGHLTGSDPWGIGG